MLHIGHQREDSPGRAAHRAGGEETDSGGLFCVYGKGIVRRREDGEGKTEKDVGLGLRRRAQAGANTWRAVDGMMADRRISKRLKGKVTSTCMM